MISPNLFCKVNLILLCLLAKITIFAQVGIGTNIPNSSSMLDITSTTKGILVPRMTSAQIAAINFPAAGLLVYQTDGQNGFYYNSGTPGLPNWINILSGPSIPQFWNSNGNNIYNVNTGNVGIGTITPVQKLDVLGNVNIPLDSSIMINNQKVLSLKGNQNVFVGLNLGLSNTGIQNSGFGNTALFNNTTGSGNSAFGRAALAFNIVGTDNSAFGRQALQNNNSGNTNAAFGIEALKLNISGNSNVALGAYALIGNNANDNTAVGYASQANNLTGNSNASIGREALFANNNGSNNTALGYQSLFHNFASYNTAAGWSSLYNNGTGTSNTAIGEEALYTNSSGNGNTALGSAALYKNAVANGNTAVGSNTLFNSTGSSNTAVGSSALYTNTTGINNTAIGNGADVSLNNLTNATAIGYATFVNSSNSITIGNSLITQVGGYVNWSNLSDSRFKMNVQNNVPGLIFITKLKPVTYQLDLKKLNQHIYKDNAEVFTKNMSGAIVEKQKIIYSGFLAQEVESAAKSIGYNFSGVIPPQYQNSNYSLSYADFVVPLVKSIQEQQVLIEKLQKQIAELENKFLLNKCK